MSDRKILKSGQKCLWKWDLKVQMKINGEDM
jgi:hypothetical protein